jgi:hypothetical protein
MENLENKCNSEFIDPEIIEKNKEELKKRFLLQKEKDNQKKINKNKDKVNSKDDYLVNLLKDNSEILNLLNNNEGGLNDIINSMISKMTNDPKQKKIMRKKMKTLIENMKK